LSPQTLYRGLYVRIANKLEVDPSYVSRVARGERQSKEVERALRSEISHINRKLGRSHLSTASTPKASGKRLHSIVKQNRARIQKQWLQYCEADPNLRRVRLSSQRRESPVKALLGEVLRVMQLSLKEMPSAAMKAAARHGSARRKQGYSVTALLEEYNLVRRSIFGLAQDFTEVVRTDLLVHDLSQIGEALDLQMQTALKAFSAQAIEAGAVRFNSVRAGRGKEFVARLGALVV
jgi:hypothetical protein